MRRIIIILCIFLTTFSVFAQVAKNSNLYKTILSKDSLLFNVGFNTCDISQFENLFSENFEFFHDKSGSSDKKKFLNDLRNGLCANTANYQARRELLPESTEIYALYDKENLYGAIQEGVHQFFEKQLNKPEEFGSSAKFTHVWLLENGAWKLTKSLSFEHQIKQLPTTNTAVADHDNTTEQGLKEKKLSGIAILSYNHIGLAVKDLNISAAFYREIVGLLPLDLPENLVAIRRWFKIAPGQELHLLLGREKPVANNDKNGAHFSLSIGANAADGIEAFLKSKNLPYVRQKRFDGAYQIFITDPDGYVIELNEPKK
jgi:catechol 2,3-dioxygenase-like lactoylglutathione lyase family enzyme